MNTQAISQSEWTKYVRLYLQNIDVKISSKKVYAKALDQWLYFIKNDNPSDVNIVLRYKQSLIERKLSAYTICVYLNAVKNLFQYLEDNQITYNIAKSIRVKKPKSQRQALTKSEVLRLLALDFTDDIEGLRDKAILYLMIYTGLREISITNANIENLTIAEDEKTHILFYQGKGKLQADDFVVLTDEVYKTIKNYLDKRKNINPKASLFVSLCERDNTRLSTQTIRRIVKEVFLRAGIEGKTGHSLRHSAVSFAIAMNVPIQDVQRMAGHSQIQTTMEYVHQQNRLISPAEKSIAKFLLS